MTRVKMIVLIGLAALGAVYAGTRPEEMTREEQSKLIVRVAIQAINEGDWQTLSEVYSPRFVQHRPGNLKPATWKEFELGCRIARQAMPTVHLEIEDIIAEGNKVAVRCKTTVTYIEESFSGRTTRKKIEFAEMDLFRIEGGRIVEEWSEADMEDWKTKLRKLKYVTKWK